MRAYVISRSGVSAFVFALLVAVAFAAAAPALAQTGGVSCFRSPAKLPDSAVAKFMANPAGLLAEHPQGGPTLIRAARTLAGSDVRTADALIELARNASPERKADIAAALAETAAICVWTRPDIAQLIKEKIAAAGDAPLSTAFHEVLRASGTQALGGSGGPARDILPVGRPAIGAAASEPTTAPQAGALDGPSLGRRGIVIGGSADGSTTNGTGVSTGGGVSVTGTSGGASVSSAGAATSGGDGRSNGGALNRATRFNSKIRPSQTTP
jgi:hypothetical protein